MLLTLAIRLWKQWACKKLEVSQESHAGEKRKPKAWSAEKKLFSRKDSRLHCKRDTAELVMGESTP